MIPLRDIRRQIQSVRKISHITRAMKTVSAIRLMKVQQQVLKQKPYATKIREVVADLVARTAGGAHPMLMPQGQDTNGKCQMSDVRSQVPRPSTTDPPNKSKSQAGSPSTIVCLALGSDRGLCAAFNNNLLAEIERFLKRQNPEDRAATPRSRGARQDETGHEVQLIIAGKRLRDLAHSKRLAIAQDLSGFWFGLNYDKVAGLAARFKDDYLRGRIAELWVIYTEFKSSARQTVTSERVLPIGSVSIMKEPQFPEYTYEPDAFRVLDSLLPLYYNREMWRIFLESVASEHMARMRAMDMATANAGEMIRDLTLTLNKARQEIITRELSEISSAAEVLRET